MIKLPPDITFVIQLVGFVVFWQLMRVLLFTPMQQALKARTEKTSGARTRAEALIAEAAEIEASVQAGLSAAKKEGAVTIINALFSDRTGQRMAEAFIKRYDLGPNFKFNNLRKGTGATIAQVRQEIQAGRFTVDVHLVSDPGFFDAAQKRGAFEKLDSGAWKDSEELAKKAGQYFSYPYVVTPLAYTFQPVWNSSCPGMANVKVASLFDTVKPDTISAAVLHYVCDYVEKNR